MKNRNRNIAEINRLRSEYSDRDRRLKNSDIYSSFNKGNLFIIQQRHREISRLLSRNTTNKLSEANILELGCGRGGVIIELLHMGALNKNFIGVDLLIDKLKEARLQLPEIPLFNADGQNLPFSNSTFDIVLQFTAFSSILDEQIKRNMATEMLRVLKIKGVILWYDFWLNPTNKQTKGIRKQEIRSLFPGCTYDFHKITLAPPIARRLVPVSWILCMILEKLKIFNTHYLVGIKKQSA
jgi:ubiquinone/menaquinone biosynthesis C-methylase UbiE